VLAYRFETGETVAEGFVRCAADQLDRAVAELSERVNEDPIDSVHSARKAVKKTRSLLRLARGSLSAKQRRRENAALRDAARGLSAARDSEAMLATLDQLSERYTGQLPDATFQQIREELEHYRDQQRGELVASALGAQAVSELGAVRVRVDDWKLKQADWKAIQYGLWRTYLDGRRAAGRARSHRSTADWHAWRRRVKDLWYQQRLLAEVAGPAVAGQAKDAHVLADLLGDDHDLAVLRLAISRGTVRAPVDLEAVVQLIDHRRQDLQSQALALGGRVYAEKPKAFVRRMRRSWNAGRSQTQATLDQDPVQLAEATRAPHAA
jgi:CHAD domain-containing protein